MDDSLQGKIAIAILFCCLFWGEHPQNRQTQEPYHLTQEDKVLIKEGDIILRMGNGWLSQFICNTLNDTIRLPHCGILINSMEGEFDVIHVLSKEVSSIDGVQRCTLDQFTADSQIGTIRIVRMKKDLAHLLTEKATYYLNKQVPFDHAFSLQDSTAFFCSELPLHILKYHAGINLLSSQPTTLPKFSLFFDKHHFTNVLPAPLSSQPSPE